MILLVTGIGGNVGQGICRNIRQYVPDCKIVGTDIKELTGGNHLCDLVYKVPYAYDNSYESYIKSIISKEKIDGIFPSTDFECYYLSNLTLQPELFCSNNSTTEIFVDKYYTFKEFNKFGISFCDSVLPSKGPKKTWEEFIAKPRKGRGSRGLLINPNSVSELDDNEYMLQELKRGMEITTAVYVNKENKVHSVMTFERSLENGATIKCNTTDKYDFELKKIINQIIANFKIKGAFNIQSIVENGNIYPFEINCRISGTNSIRSQLGFHDVLYYLEEYIYKQPLTKYQPEQGTATRLLMDVIYKEKSDEQMLNRSTPHIIY